MILSPIQQRNSNIAILALPLPTFYIIYTIFDLAPWYAAVPLAGATFFGMHHAITKIILDPLQSDAVKKSKYFLGVVADSVILVGWSWLRTLVHCEFACRRDAHANVCAMLTTWRPTPRESDSDTG